MSNPTIERVRRQPMDLSAGQVGRLRTIFLEAFNEVMECYTGRLIQLQVEDRMPIYVLSLQLVERIAASLKEKPAGSLSLVMPPPVF